MSKPWIRLLARSLLAALLGLAYYAAIRALFPALSDRAVAALAAVASSYTTIEIVFPWIVKRLL